MTKTKSQKMRAKGEKPRSMNMAPVDVAKIVKANKSNDKRKKRFLDFQIQTTQVNSGTQQYGAGQSMGRNVRSVDESYMPVNQAPMAVGTSAPSAKRSVIVQEREPLGDNDGLVHGSVNFESSLVLRVNPGLPEFFDWASRSANLYERYMVEELYVEFVPSVSAYADAGKAGRIILTADYNSAGDGPANIREAEVNVPNALGVPYGSVRLDLTPKLATTKPGKFVRRGPVAGDITLYDAAVVHFSTMNFETTGPIGQLFVGYKFRLLDPQLTPSSLAPTFKAISFKAIGSRTSTSTGGSDNINPGTGWTVDFGTGINSKAFGSGTLPIEIVNDTIGGVDFKVPRGHYLITATMGFNIAGTTLWDSFICCFSSAVEVANGFAITQDYQKRSAMGAFDAIANRLSVIVSVAEETQNVSLYLRISSTAGGTWAGTGSVTGSVGFPMVQFLLLD